MASVPSQSLANLKPVQPGEVRNPKGRPKGVPNKINGILKEAILQAFGELGGVDYLVRVGKTDPKTFCALLGRVLPMQVAAEGDNVIVLCWEGEEKALEGLDSVPSPAPLQALPRPN